MGLFKTFKILIPAYVLLFSLQGMAQEALIAAFKDSYSLESAGEYSKAADKLKAVYDENSYETNLRLGWLTYEAGKLNESLQYYARAIALKPYAIEPRLGLAYPLYAMGKIDELVSVYHKVLEIDPQNALANYRLGLVYYYRAGFDKAEAYFEKVINLYPFDYETLLMLAWTKLKLQKSREAKVLFTKVLLYKPGDASALEGLSYIK